MINIYRARLYYNIVSLCLMFILIRKQFQEGSAMKNLISKLSVSEEEKEVERPSRDSKVNAADSKQIADSAVIDDYYWIYMVAAVGNVFSSTVCVFFLTTMTT